MRLNETEMVKLLPAWMQEDGGDKGLATGCDIISRDAYARLKLLSRWDKIDQLSDAELDEMAWELNIQWYDSTAPIAAKRAVIRNSDRVYAKLGTPYAVEQIVADYFGTGEVREWYQYGGQPHHFKVPDRNGDKTTARVLPSTADSMVTRPLTIPWYLRGEMGSLTPGTEVAYAMFEDGTGIILSRMDGEWDGIVPGDITVKKGALTMQDKGISVPSADVTATGISLTGHTHTDSMGGGTSGPQ